MESLVACLSWNLVPQNFGHVVLIVWLIEKALFHLQWSMMISEDMGPKTRSKTTKAKKKPEVVEPITDEEEDDDFADELEEESKFNF